MHQPHRAATPCPHSPTAHSIAWSSPPPFAMLASLRCRTVRTAALGRCAGCPHAQIVRPTALRTMSAAAAAAPSQPPRSGSKAARPASSVPVAAGAAAAAASRARVPLGPGQTELDVEGAARPTTVLLIGWLGCSSKNLEQYKKMHGQAGRDAQRSGRREQSRCSCRQSEAGCALHRARPARLTNFLSFVCDWPVQSAPVGT